MNAGSPLAKVELMGKNTKNLEAIIYFPAIQGKNQKRHESPDCPFNKPSGRFGFMLGLVTSVSEFPVSSSAMMNVLHNADISYVNEYSLPF